MCIDGGSLFAELTEVKFILFSLQVRHIVFIKVSIESGNTGTLYEKTAPVSCSYCDRKHITFTCIFEPDQIIELTRVCVSVVFLSL